MKENIETVWDFDLLWNKCQVYAEKAMSEQRESPMFGFWSALVIEFLGRCTLSSVHPVLLADPREGENILYTFGYKKVSGPPKSIVAKTVFDRCTQLVTGFTRIELDNCLKLIEKRNEELHSGSAAFLSYPIKLWLADYYKACEILLAFFGKTLIDLFGHDEAHGAIEMITKSNNALIEEVKKKIKRSQLFFEGLTPEDKLLTIENGVSKARAYNGDYFKLEKCTVCPADGVLSGKVISISEDRFVEGNITYDKIILPTKFICYSCDLKLNSHQELSLAGYGGQFTQTAIYDPAEYYGIDAHELPIDNSWDYGND
ncbi:hypothetical protein GCM10027037_06420 [Mucilaginibacter koreensis]